jgi:hypothetical protein
MKTNNTLISRRKIASALFILIMISGSLTFFSFTLKKVSDDLFSQLGLSKNDAEYSIGNSILYGYLQHYSARNLKNIAAGNRATVVNELGAYTKEYVSTEDFKKQYTVLREQKKPVMPAQPRTAEEIRQQYISDIQKGLQSTKDAMQNMQDDMKPVMQASIDMFEEQLKEYEDPNSPTIESLASYEQLAYDYGMQDYKKQLAAWEQEWPADHMPLVKKRLQQFLDATKDVDYTAALKDGYGGKKVFVNPAYESKSADWKKAYRAGKEATTAAREFASGWLNELKNI